MPHRLRDQAPIRRSTKAPRRNPAPTWAHARPLAWARGLALLVLIVPLAAFSPTENLFAPSAKLWERWQQHGPENPDVIDFSDWDHVLKAYVNANPSGVNLFDYGAVTPEDRAGLEAVIARLAALPVSSYARPQQLAYWINLYNALTVQVVLDHYPVASIRDIDISPGFFSDGPWDKALIEVEGTALTLNDIEHRILRPIWRDPRIHYAVNCASIGCPNLSTEAYLGASIEEQLDAAARSYINDPRGVSIDDGKVTVSKIYDWFYEDFGRTPMSLLEHLARYAEPDLAMKLRDIGEIHDTEYDWTLNRAPGSS